MVLTHENLLKTDGRCVTQLAKMSTEPKFVELTADIVRILLLNLVVHFILLCSTK